MADGGARRSRLRDVAELAGVSTMTVVRTMREPAKVADTTRARVEAALLRTGYTPDLVARALASQRTGMIAALAPLLSNSLIADVVQGMSDAVAGYGFHMMIGATGFSLEREEELVRAFLARRVDAIFVTGIMHTPDTVRMLRDAGIPVVEGANLPEAPIDSAVGFSNFNAARSVVRHLCGRYEGPTGCIVASSVGNDRMRDRHGGWAAALEESGRAADPSLTATVELSLEAGAAALGTLMARHPNLRAVFCGSDVLAAGALFECQRRGIDVPGRLAIAGFDDLDIARQVVPALTTVRVPRYEIGWNAGQMIIDRIAGRARGPRTVDLGFDLLVRASA
jgi:LacI family gluconate utilization system Gnt-I transcriptional repressor